MVFAVNAEFAILVTPMRSRGKRMDVITRQPHSLAEPRNREGVRSRRAGANVWWLGLNRRYPLLARPTGRLEVFK